MTTKRKTYHVTPRQEGWAVTPTGATRASAATSTKAEAVARAKELAKKAHQGQVVIHGRDGRIQTEHTYGSDPYPPKG